MFYVKEPSFLTDVGIRSCSLRTTGRINPSPPILSLRGLKNMFVSRSLSLWFLSLEWYWHLFYEVYFWEKDVEQIKVFFVVVVFFFFFFKSPFPLTFFLASGEDVTPSPSQPLISSGQASWEDPERECGCINRTRVTACYNLISEVIVHSLLSLSGC